MLVEFTTEPVISPSYSSDPEIQAAQARADAYWREQSPAHVPRDANYIAPEEVSNIANLVAAEPPLWRSGFVVAALIVSAFVYYSFSAGAVQETANESAAKWNLEINSGGHKPVKMLAYGKNAGLHLVTVEPPMKAVVTIRNCRRDCARARYGCSH